MAAAETISPSAIRRLSKELGELTTNAPEGIKIIVNPENILDVQAWIQGPEDTPFQGGCFRVRLVLSSDFPNTPPKGFFLTKIFHPNVSKSGEICVNVLKKDWKKEYGIRHIFLTIKCLLIDPNPESALNEEAGRLLLEDYVSYAKHAKLMTSIHGINKSISFGNSTDGESSSSGGGGGGAKSESTHAQQENIRIPVGPGAKSDPLVKDTTLPNCVAAAAEVLTDSNGRPPSPKRRRAAAGGDAGPIKDQAKVVEKKRTLRRL
ncbi:putative ubiquitin carrier protein E2 [Phlyctochytrium arcticum]|nr:putative ubiquitin carrier protein E2 [Phlyctochytrium arcticum]